MRTPITRTGVLVAAALAPTLAAQGDFDFDQTTPATLGATLRLDYQGAPGSRPMMFMLSLTGGPTPLQLLFGGTDTRSLQVGVDLISTWGLTGTTASGTGSFAFPVPAQASLQGLALHLQLMTGGTTTLIDRISNKIVVVAGAAGSTDILTARLGDGRTPKGPGRGLAAVFPIMGSKGRFMLAGGGVGNILGATGLKTSEIYDTRTHTVTPGPDLGAARALATATMLANGKVLLAGGVDSNGDPTATCELYDPATNKFVATGSMSERRAGHAAALLGNGRVLVVAGTRELSDVAKVITGILSSAEIYNPATGLWTAAAPIRESVIGPALTTLPNGRVLVSGGAKITFGPFSIPLSVDSVRTCQLYDVAQNQWSNANGMVQSRAVHADNTIVLSDGRVLVTGGVFVQIGLLPPPTTFAGATAVATCEVFNPASGTWTSLPAMSVARSGHTAVQMKNGRVLIAGGARGAIDAAVSNVSVQEFDPTTNRFVRDFPMRTARSTHGAIVTPAGDLLVFGGTVGSASTTTLDTIELVHQ